MGNPSPMGTWEPWGQAHSRMIHSAQHEMNSLVKQGKGSFTTCSSTVRSVYLGLDFWKMKECLSLFLWAYGRCMVDSSAGGWKPLGHVPVNLAVFGDQGLFRSPQVLSKDGN